MAEHPQTESAVSVPVPVAVPVAAPVAVPQLRNFKIGQLVQINGRHLTGRVAYVGRTNFAGGDWIGVVLPSNKGKNNGTVRGRCYFRCATNCGIFVRPAQLTPLPLEPIKINSDNNNTEANDLKQPHFIKQHIAMADADADDDNASAERVTAKCDKDTANTNSAGLTVPSPSVAPEPAPVPTPAAALLPQKQPTQHLLKTTKISKPKLITSSSQLALNTAVSCLASNTICAPLPHALPKRSKTTVSPTESFCCSKRASFVETGFLEILRPQFTPGQSLRSPQPSNAPSTTNVALACASEQPTHHKPTAAASFGELLQLREELGLLRQQQLADKQHFKECEKVRLQNEQLLEFKTQIMEQQRQLQCELQRCRHELRNAHELNAKYRNELDELADSMELLALDKDMADERVETMQMELEVLQERNEELSLDVEILRAEHESHSLSIGCNAEQLANFQNACDIKRLEQYNQRLRETVIRLRDALTSDKQELQRTNKELETKHSEIAELKQTKELLSKRVDLMETHIIDLKEQVDAALGAETMVATLADLKLELEERVKLLEEEVSELEALEEIHEQLIESNQELEHDLREEIDLLHAQLRTLQQQKDAAMESVYERDVTIMKFRELVRTLNEQIRDAGNTCLTTEDFSSTGSAAEETQSLDYQHIFTVTKAYGRAIDQKLNAIALQLKAQHIEQLLAFVPEKILLRGGEHDVILVLLMLQSITAKVDVLTHGIMEKFPANCEFDRDTIFEGYSVQRSAFRSKALFMLRSLNMLLQQLLYMLQRCDYEHCTHAAIYRSEIEAQEQRLDEMLRQLKAGLLDEHTPCDSFERVLGFFNMLYNNLLAPKQFAELVDEQQLHGAFLDVLEAAVDSINTNASLLHTVLKLDDEQSDSYHCMQLLTEQLSQLKQQLRKLQRKFAAAGNMAFVAFSGMQWERMQHILATQDVCGRVINILTASTADTSRELSAAKANNPDDEVSIEHEKLWRILSLHCAKLAPEQLQAPNELFQHCTELLTEELGHYATYIETQESDKCHNLNTVYVRAKANTLMQRAAQVKQHYQDIKTLEQTLAERDKELKTQKYMVKMKQNDYSELQIRKEMAERNFAKQQSDYEQSLLQFVTQFEQLQQQVTERELSVGKALDTLATRLQQCGDELAQFKQKSTQKRQQASTSSDETHKELECLQQMLRQKRRQAGEQQARQMKRCLRQMQPLHVPQLQTEQAADIRQLQQRLQTLKRQWLLTHIRLRPPNVNAQMERLQLQQQCEQLAKQIVEIYLEQHPHQAAQTLIGIFPKPQYRTLLMGN